jgi:galactokinase
MTVGEVFEATYAVAPAGVWSAPGRVNLIGEHTDYNDGFVLPFAIAARTSVAAVVRTDGELRMRSAQQPDGDVSVSLDVLAPGTPEGWSAYVAGVVWAARQAGHPVAGLDVLVDGRVPLGSGLSSSHALECAALTALNDLFSWGLSRNELGRLTQVAENDFVGAPTGMMDQLASLRCTAGNALFLDNRTLHAEQVPLDPAADGYRLLVLDTMVHHGNADGAYGERRTSCEKAAKALGVPALRDIELGELDDALARLDDDETRARVRHIVTENDRVLSTVAALRATPGPDWSAVGRLMVASHDSLRDDYEVSCPELDVAVAAALGAGAIGARMTGGGFGGSAIALVPVAALSSVATAAAAAFRSRGWREPTVAEVTPSAGARRDA